MEPVTTHSAPPAIEVAGVAKEYLLYDSARARFADLLLGRQRRARRFTALADVSLAVPAGRTVGVIGRNGAGKSTLLSIVAGVVAPTRGQVRVRGRLGALLELGAGFHPEYTGRENVRMAASLIGLSRAEIDRRFAEIVEFAGIGEHMEQPLRTYSSGMVVRLAFAVHALLEPDVLIVDEALAVGDAAFQAKCFARLRELKRRGTAILLVTHDTQSVRLFCDEAVWIDHGRVRMQGDPARVCDAYLQELHGGQAPLESEAGAYAPTPSEDYASEVDLAAGGPDGAVRWGRGGGRLLWAGLSGAGHGSPVFRFGERLRLSVVFRCDAPPTPDLSVAFTILHRKSLELLYGGTLPNGVSLRGVAPGQPYRVDFEFDNILAADDYAVALALWQYLDGQADYLDFASGLLHFKVVSDTVVHALAAPKLSVRLLEER